MVGVRSYARPLVPGPGRWLLLLAVLMVLTLAGQPVWAEPVRVDISGVGGEMLNNVRSYLSISRYVGKDLSEARVRQLHVKAAAEISQALQPFGYYEPKVQTSIKLIDGQWLAHYGIDPGVATRISRIDIQLLGKGQDDPLLTKPVADFPLKVGDVIDHRRYSNGKNLILSRALENGYLDAQYQRSNLIIDVRAHQARIELSLKTGARYRFGTLRMHQDALKPELLRRLLPIKEGEPYTNAKLLSLQYTLDDTGYFSRVEVDPRQDQAQDLAVPIDISLKPHKPSKYTIGFGYGTDTGPRLLLGYDNRLINSSGHRFTSLLTLSTQTSSASATYSIPIDNPATDRVEFVGGLQDQEIDDRRSFTQTLAVNRINVFGRWTRTLGLNLLRERYDLDTQPQRTSNLVMPRVAFSYGWTQGDRRGLRWNIETKAADDNLLSTTTFAQLHSDVKFLQGLWPGGKLILRGEGGTTAISDFESLPLSQRFFAGGDTSVRGYGYKELGPKDSEGEVVGGRYLITGSAELNQQVYGNWGVATFYDIGNAFNDLALGLKQSTGVGLIWKTPVGPLRIYVARTLSEPKPTYRLHVLFGPDI